MLFLARIVAFPTSWLGLLAWIGMGILLKFPWQGWIASVFYNGTLGQLKMYFGYVGVLPLPYPGSETLAKTALRSATSSAVVGTGFVVWALMSKG